MSYTDTSGSPESPVLALQHKDFPRQQFDLDYRGHKRCVRIIDRVSPNGDTEYWVFDQDATGDLTNAVCWMVNKAQRPGAGWSFGWASVIAGYGKSKDVATPDQRGNVGKGKRVQGPMSVLPISDQSKNKDTRFIPINIPVDFMVGKGPGGVGNNDKGSGEAQGNDPTNSDGPAFQKVEPKPLPAQRIDSGSDVLQLGIGASATAQGFGGPGVGTGGRLGFNFAGGSDPASLSGIPGVGTQSQTKGSKGNVISGASFIDPTSTTKR